MQWEDRTETPPVAEVSAGEVLDWLERVDPAQAAAVICATGLQPLILLDSACRDGILQHLAAFNEEAGGLLLGQVYRQPGDLADQPSIIQVTHAVPADADGTAVSVRMSPEVWTAANRLREDYGLMILGWFHSHPNLGAFFSSVDRRTQAETFYHPYSLGLVVDPVRGEEIWFLGPQSQQIAYPVIVLSPGSAASDRAVR
jgi:proteasome lid subunit RPN8/RPN11